jgi:multisubunit Na+/H+ antiporter MnhE subunit
MSNVRASRPVLTGRFAVVAVRLGLLSVLWVTLVEGHPEGLALGLVVLPLAAWVSLVLEPPGGVRLQPMELLRFLPHGLGHALRGSLEVARLALHREVRLTPGELETRCRLPRGPARTFLHGMLGLVPGTLAVEAEGEGDSLRLHLLDASPESRATALAQLRDLEGRVARVFGLPPPPRGLS